jgi:hypothetical protein
MSSVLELACVLGSTPGCETSADFSSSTLQVVPAIFVFSCFSLLFEKTAPVPFGSLGASQFALHVTKL